MSFHAWAGGNGIYGLLGCPISIIFQAAAYRLTSSNAEHFQIAQPSLRLT